VKNLSDLIVELTILLDPLQAQIKILEELSSDEMQSVMMQRDGQSAGSEQNQISERYKSAERSRKAHVNSLKTLQDRAKETQALVGFDHPSFSRAWANRYL
jgi:Mg2+ and Co2+ transporter CorA